MKDSLFFLAICITAKIAPMLFPFISSFSITIVSLKFKFSIRTNDDRYGPLNSFLSSLFPINFFLFPLSKFTAQNIITPVYEAR